MAHPAGTGRQLKIPQSSLIVAGVVALLVLGFAGERDTPKDARAMGQLPGTSPTVRANPAAAIGDPEALLFKTLLAIRNNQLDLALNEIDQVIESYPTFRLAHLIKGDLLLARRQPLTGLGNAEGAPEDRLSGLRDEARARLARYQHERPRNRVPRYLLQLQPEQKYAFVVDSSKSTLYVFENREGIPRYVADYYVSAGKNGTDKYKEGDKRTPLGVYHVTTAMPREKLGDFYGSGAFPISYPNEWDRREGRNGSGIWLHGTPSDTYSRPPRASDGCVVLTNNDLETISSKVQVGLTPVIIANDVDWVTPEATAGLRQELGVAIERWRKDWESLDTDRYLSHYGTNFNADRQDRKSWGEQKRSVNAGKKWVKIGVERVSMFLYPGHENLAVVTFDQKYSSSNLNNDMRKRQYWIRENGGWKIIYEGAA